MNQVRQKKTNKGRYYEVREWCIENISYLTRMTHCAVLGGSCLMYILLKTANTSKFDLIVSDELRSSYLEISYLSSEGDLIRRQEERNPNWDQYSQVHIRHGPKLKEIIEKNCRDPGKDFVTVRCRLRRWGRSEYRFSHSTFRVVDFSLKISSRMFTNFPFDCTKVLSYIFVPVDAEKRVFHLEASLKKPTSEKAAVAFSLRNSDEADRIKIRCGVTLLGQDDTVLKSCFHKGILTYRDGSWVIPSDLTLEELSVKERVLVFQFTFISSDCLDRVSVKGGNPLRAFCETKLEVPNNLILLSKKLMSLYKSAEFSDFKLLCGEKSFPVHRCILSARSPVFKALLSQEDTTDVYEMADTDPAIVRHLLKFVYAGYLKNLSWKNAFKLYLAAQKFEIASLQEQCLVFFRAKVSPTNVNDIVLFAKKQEDHCLKMVAHDYVLDNSRIFDIFPVGSSILAKKEEYATSSSVSD